MGRAAKPAENTKPIAEKVSGEYSLNATEAYQLNPLQVQHERAEAEHRRAIDGLQRLGASVLDRYGVQQADMSEHYFDLRDDGVFLVRRES